MQRIDLEIDVTDAAGLGESASIAVTVHLPDAERLGSPPVVCFAKPGGGFARAYFTADLPGPGAGVSQAAWHAERGWVFVAVDHLGTGTSSTHHDPARLDFATVTAASHAAEHEILERLAKGTLHPTLPALPDPVVLGVGQSMGGCLTVAQQGRHHRYDGIAVLGFGAAGTHLRVPPGEPPIVRPWVLRDSPPDGPAVVVNTAQIAAAERVAQSLKATTSVNRWLFYYDDVDVAALATGHGADDGPPPWISTTYPQGVTASCLTPGVVAAEAAAVQVPVLVAMGERDVVTDPRGEPRAYLSATSVDLYACPRMGHMHNFASTRELLWHRLHTWAAWVTEAARSQGSHAP